MVLGVPTPSSHHHLVNHPEPSSDHLVSSWFEGSSAVNPLVILPKCRTRPEGSQSVPSSKTRAGAGPTFVAEPWDESVIEKQKKHLTYISHRTLVRMWTMRMWTQIDEHQIL